MSPEGFINGNLFLRKNIYFLIGHYIWLVYIAHHVSRCHLKALYILHKDKDGKPKALRKKRGK